jgi:hypothetical protein
VFAAAACAYFVLVLTNLGRLAARKGPSTRRPFQSVDQTSVVGAEVVAEAEAPAPEPASRLATPPR